VGNLSEEEAVEQFNKYLGGWNSSNRSSAVFMMPERNPTKFFFVHKDDSAQSEIRIGHLAKKRNAADYIPARIMNTILGGQFASRINHNLREDKGFTYGANSVYHYYQDAGSFEVSTAVNIENTGASVSEIIKELVEIRKNISPEEIDFAKSYLIKQFPSRFETYSQVAKNIEQLLIHNLALSELTDYTKKIEAAEYVEVKSSALENVFPEELVVVAVGDREKVSSQLKSLSGEEPTELDNNGNVLN
jgi:zinc protease